MSDKTTSSDAATAASQVLRDGRTGEDSKSAAGSALSQVESGKVTGDDAAQSASEVLQSDDTSTTSKKAAGSALSQKED